MGRVLLFVLVSFWPLFANLSWSQCHKSFRITGTANNGTQMDFVRKWNRPQRELSGFDPIMEEQEDAKKYKPFYRVIRPPTNKQNCAGYVIEKKWNIPNLYLAADEIYQRIIQNFGKEVSSPQPGDIVVFGYNEHVGIVIRSTGSNRRAIIQSKDNRESVLEGELYLDRIFGDEILNRYSFAKFYRVNSTVKITPVGPGHCDTQKPLTLEIEVAELAYNKIYPISGASVTITIKGGGSLGSGTSNGKGKVSFSVQDNKEVANGVIVKATKTGYHDRIDEIEGDYLMQDPERGWLLYMDRTPDNPVVADPNIPIPAPDPQKVIDNLNAKLDALEKKISEAEKGEKAVEESIKKFREQLKTLDKVRSEAEGLQSEVTKLKSSVARIKELCTEFKRIVTEMNSKVKQADQLGLEFEDLLDRAGKLKNKCENEADVQAMKDALEDAVEIMGKIKTIHTAAEKDNAEIQKLILEQLKEASTVTKGEELFEKLKKKKEEINKAHANVHAAYHETLNLKGKLTQRWVLEGDCARLKPYDFNLLPPAIQSRFNGLEARIGKLKTDIPFTDKPDVYLNVYQEADKIVNAAGKTLTEYKKDVCKITLKDDLVTAIDGLLTATVVGLVEISDLKEKAKECEEKLKCDDKITQLGPLLDRGDIESARPMIDQLKNLGCDVTAIEARYWEVHSKVYPLLSGARDAWNEAAGSCDYQNAYTAALELSSAFPDQPWIVQNLSAIKQAADAQKKVESLLSSATTADGSKDFEGAAKFIDQADQAATGYPCLKEMVRKYKEEFARGKPNTEYLKLLEAALKALENCEWEKALALRSQARDKAPQPALVSEYEARNARMLDNKIREFADAEAAVKIIQGEFKTAKSKEDWQRLLDRLEAIRQNIVPCERIIQPSIDDLIAKTKEQIKKGGGSMVDEETLSQCRTQIGEIQQLIASGNGAQAADKLRKIQIDCKDLTIDIDGEISKLEQQLNQLIQTLVNEINATTASCEFESALTKAQLIRQISANDPWIVQHFQDLEKRALAQRQARQYLIPAQAAIQSKDLNGAINALKQAESVPDLPVCMKDKIKAMRQDLEQRKRFVELTEKVEVASANCQYNQAELLIAQIKSIRISEASSQQVVKNWLSTNEPKLVDLKERDQKTKEEIQNAQKLANQADALSKVDPPDWNSISPLLQSTAQSLAKAENMAPKCVRDREKNRIEAIRQQILNIQRRKKVEIEVSIALLIDASGSMGDAGKMEKAKRAARASVSNVSKTTEMAILIFSGGCGPDAMRVISGFSTNSADLINAINSISHGGGTPMYLSTARAVEWVQANGKGRNKSIVLLSDGADTCKDKKTQAGDAIRSSKIPVNTIGFDVNNNAEAQRELQELANMSKGKNYSAGVTDPREIRRVMIEAVMQGLLKPADVNMGSANSALVSGYFDQAKSMIDQQNLNGALLQYQQAYKVAPNSASVNFNLSLVYEAGDQLISAKQHAEEYLKLSPSAYDVDEVKGRIAYIEDELQKNPRFKGDPNQCADLYRWAQREQLIVKRTKNDKRMQAILEIRIASQKGDCETAHQLEAKYVKQFKKSQ